MENPPPPHATVLRPAYHKDRRELSFNGDVVKRFRQPAAKQELILMAFQEQGWPERIDDPLPKIPGKNPKKRLHDVEQNLNRNQHARVLHFFGDGTGRGICWRLA